MNINILSVLAIVSFLLTLPQLWGSNWKDIWLYHYKGVISWNCVNKAILKIIDKLKNENFHASLIIGVGRGGIICSGLLCSELTNDKLIESLGRGENKIQTPTIKLGTINSIVFLKNYRLNKAKRDRKTLSKVDKIELSNTNIDIKENEKILIIVAQNFSGSTLEKATNILIKKKIPRKNIRTVAVFWYKYKNINIVHEPDIFGKRILINKTMPWKKDSKINTDRY